MAGVPDAVKEFHVGGYAVLTRWMKQRSQRQINELDVAYFHRLVDAIQQTLDITDRIDQDFSCPRS